MPRGVLPPQTTVNERLEYRYGVPQNILSAPMAARRCPTHKNTWDIPSSTMPPPEKVILPMQQHIGAPCIPTVKKGDHVYVGTVVGDSEAYVSAPVHASVSGTVTEITQVMLTGGQMNPGCGGGIRRQNGERPGHRPAAPPSPPRRSWPRLPGPPGWWAWAALASPPM